MYERLNAREKARVDRIFDGLSVCEKVGQTFCVTAKGKTPGEVSEVVEKYAVGGVFYAYQSTEETAEITAAANRASATPVIAAADLVNGAGCRLENATLFPWQMAVGAADSEELSEKMGIATAREGRAAGVHWTFGPIVDLSINMLNAMMHTRTFGEDRDHVLRMGKAFIRGVQQEGLMAATPKHFPGDGVDDRDSHVCTSINSLSEDAWFESFGHLWQEVIDAGAMCIMAGFIALPWLDPRDHYAGPLPAALSRRIQIDLLRERLGFKGVLVSDALPMIGFAAMAPTAQRAPLNIESGSDMLLWPDLEHDMKHMMRALDTGLLSEARLDTAVRNVLALKLRLGLMDAREYRLPEDAMETHQAWADAIGDRSISVIRNADGNIPVQPPEGAKILTVSITFDEDTRGFVDDLHVVDEELRARGYQVTHLMRPSDKELQEAIPDHDVVFMNVHVLPRYGSTRFYAGAAQTLWNAVWIDHPCVVFTSFGDPYKLYEMPYVPNYINAYSNTPSSQRAAVKVWLGEIEARGKIPVDCPGYFSKTTS